MQNILNKLHKFTSAQEPMKVEMGYVEDTRALLDKADEIFGQGMKQAMRASEAYDEAAKAYQQALKKVEDMEQFMKDAASRGFPQENLRPTVEKFKRLAESSIKQSQRYSQTAISITKF